jgi:hypothetical protein
MRSMSTSIPDNLQSEEQRPTGYVEFVTTLQSLSDALSVNIPNFGDASSCWPSRPCSLNVNPSAWPSGSVRCAPTGSGGHLTSIARRTGALPAAANRALDKSRDAPVIHARNRSFSLQTTRSAACLFGQSVRRASGRAGPSPWMSCSPASGQRQVDGRKIAAGC